MVWKDMYHTGSENVGNNDFYCVFITILYFGIICIWYVVFVS